MHIPPGTIGCQCGVRACRGLEFVDEPTSLRYIDAYRDYAADDDLLCDACLGITPDCEECGGSTEP